MSNVPSYLIVGGTGVLSSAVVEALVAKKFHVTTITRGNRRSVNGAESVVCNCRDYERLHKLIGSKRFDVVIDFLSFNASGVKAAFDFYSKISRRYVFISSAFVYDFTKGKNFNENAPRGMSFWSYSVGKKAAEDCLLEVSAGNSCAVTIVRPMVTYGNTRIPYGLAPKHGYDWTFVSRVKAGKPIITWNGGRNRCNITRVEDFSKTLAELLQGDLPNGAAYNVCGDETPAWCDTLKAVGDYIKLEVKKVDIPVDFIAENFPDKREEIRARALDAIVDNSKIKNVVSGSFGASISLIEGVARTLQAYEEEAYQYGIDWRYDGLCDRVINLWNKSNWVCS